MISRRSRVLARATLWFALGWLGLLTGQTLASPDAWRREGWHKTDFTRTSIGWDEIQSGGPPKDGIPSIDDPSFVSVADPSSLAKEEPVLALRIGDDARAYPLRVLIWHEIVNDVVGGTPVAVTYCPLCNSAVVFERRVGERLLDFGTTGKLRKSDLVMYDRQTETWWQQFTGEAIVGAMSGNRLTMVPAGLVAYGEFAARHPKGRVLVPRDAKARDYGANPYAGYDSAPAPFLYQGEMPTGVEPMARVVVVRADPARPVIVAMDHIRSGGTFVRDNIEITWRAGQLSALDTARIVKGRDVGTIEVFDVSTTGHRLTVAHDVTFAFVAHAFHPQVPIITK